MDIKNVFNDFCNYLQNRTGELTEDNIRFYWFACMLAGDNNLNNYTLEASYDKLLKNGNTKAETSEQEFADIKMLQELDLEYKNELASEQFFFEIKFHHNPGKNNRPRTQSAGKILNDLRRLATLKKRYENSKCMFLYVTDTEMNNYLIKKSSSQGNSSENNVGVTNSFPLFNETKDIITMENVNYAKTQYKAAHTSDFGKNNESQKISTKLLFKKELDCKSESLGKAQDNINCFVRLFEVL